MHIWRKGGYGDGERQLEDRLVEPLDAEAVIEGANTILKGPLDGVRLD